MKRKINQEKPKILIIAGIFLIIGSSATGIEKTVASALNHLAKDLTEDLLIHTYIGGFVLVVLGLYFLIRKKYEKKKR